MIAASVFVVTLLTTIALAPPHPARRPRTRAAWRPSRPCDEDQRAASRQDWAAAKNRRQGGLETAPEGSRAP